jgi:lysophospholipase L1-like esterase
VITPSSSSSGPAAPLAASQGKRRRWSFAKVAGVLVLSLVLLVVVTDVGLAVILGLGNALLIQPDPAAGYVIKPNQRVRRFFCNTIINGESMRSPAFSPVKPPGTYRVLLIGDSMTYGSTQVDQKAIFASLLRAELPARLHEPVEILNASAGAWAIGNELGYLKSRGTFDADLVVLVLNSGDIGQSPTGLNDLGGDAATVKPPCALCEVWTRYLKSKMFHIKPKMDKGAELSTDVVQIVTANLRWLDEFQQDVQQHHARMGMIYLAMRKYVPDNAKLSAQPVLVNWATQHHVPFLDITSAETSYPWSDITLDGVHFNAKGHRIAATYIEQNWSEVDPDRLTAATGQTVHP